MTFTCSAALTETLRVPLEASLWVLLVHSLRLAVCEMPLGHCSAAHRHPWYTSRLNSPHLLSWKGMGCLPERGVGHAPERGCGSSTVFEQRVERGWRRSLRADLITAKAVFDSADVYTSTWLPCTVVPNALTCRSTARWARRGAEISVSALLDPDHTRQPSPE
jgi:hypothetical protein